MAGIEFYREDPVFQMSRRAAKRKTGSGGKTGCGVRFFAFKPDFQVKSTHVWAASTRQLNTFQSIKLQLRQAQAKDGNSGHYLTGKQPAAIEFPN